MKFWLVFENLYEFSAHLAGFEKTPQILCFACSSFCWSLFLIHIVWDKTLCDC